MTWRMKSREAEWTKGKFGYISLWNDDSRIRPRHYGCYFRYKPAPEVLPSPQQVFEALFPDAPEYSERRMIDYLLMLLHVRGGIACDFTSYDGGKTIYYNTIRRDEINAELAELIEVYEAGVPVEDILA